MSASSLSSALSTMLAAGMAISAAQHQEDLAAAVRGRQLIDACFNGCDVLLAPSTIGVENGHNPSPNFTYTAVLSNKTFAPSWISFVRWGSKVATASTSSS